MAFYEEEVRGFNQAVKLAFAEAGVDGMDWEMAKLFRHIVEQQPVFDQVNEVAAAVLKKEYGKGVGWYVNDWWLVAVPKPRYEARGLSSLIIETNTWLVVSARAKVSSVGSSFSATIIVPWGKQLRTIIPLNFLRSLLEGTQDRYRIVGKDGSWTLWEVAGLKSPLKLNDDFVECLKNVLARKPLSDWLEEFGKRGRSICPLVVGTLLGLTFRDENEPVSIEDRPLDMETLVVAATSLGYSTARVQQAIERAGPAIHAQMTNQEALTALLKYIE